MKNINYIWTKKAEDDARTKGLEPRRAGTAAYEVTRCDHDLNNPHDNMRVWRKAGFIKTMLPTHIAVETYYYDINGNCWGLYNITEKLSDDGNRRVINFDYLREWTQDNINELVAECIRMREMDITHQGEAVTAC